MVAIQLTTQRIHDITGDVLVIGAASTVEKQLALSTQAATIDELVGGLIQQRYAEGEFKASPGEIFTIHPLDRLPVKRVIVIGLGAQQKMTAQSLQRASTIAARHAQSTGARHITLALQREQLDAFQQIQAEVEGALLGLYTFSAYQTGEKAPGISTLQVLRREEGKTESQQALEKGRALAEATNFARDLVNEPPAVLTPTELAQRASQMAHRTGIECEILDKSRIEELGMGGLLGVARGSAEPPQFVILRYRGAAESDQTLALVGKGITFDTGGISLKPAEHMDTMKGDMGGAAAVIGAMQAIATLKPNINVTALIPTCENMPSGTAYHPGDILRLLNGKTIEIVNTDAEGRLILADALSYAVKEGYSPIIDLATLTGGIVVALGSVMTGLFCNDDTLRDHIIDAGHSAGEKYWPMPLDDDYGELISSDIADIKQTGGRGASSVTAAKILEQFVGDTSWAHLDIAGTSYLDNKKPYQEKGATGVGVRTLAELALRLATK